MESGARNEVGEREGCKGRRGREWKKRGGGGGGGGGGEEGERREGEYLLAMHTLL